MISMTKAKMKSMLLHRKTKLTCLEADRADDVYLKGVLFSWSDTCGTIKANYPQDTGRRVSIRNGAES